MASLNGEFFALLTDYESPFQNLHTFTVNSEGGGEGQNSQSQKRCRNQVQEEEPSNGILREARNGTPLQRTTRSSTSTGKGILVWNDLSTECLLDAYTDKIYKPNQSGKGTCWVDVARIVNQHNQCGGITAKQCIDKMHTLKKRYTAELLRMNRCGSSTVSDWPWFEKMHKICTTLPPSIHVSHEDNAVNAGVSSSPDFLRLSKRPRTCSPSDGGGGLAQMTNPRWKRVVLKVSGAALIGAGPQYNDPEVTLLIAREVARACHLGVEVAIVLGGRNFFCGDRWVAATGMENSTAYQLGLIATLTNSVILQSALEKLNVQTRVQSPFPLLHVTEPFNIRKAIQHLQKGRVVIFGGIDAGASLSTTDTTAALRASEIGAEAVLKGTNVDGVYDGSSGNSVAFKHMSYRELISRGDTSIDMMAISFCEVKSIPVVVFNLLVPGNICKALCGEQIGTLIDQSGTLS